MILNNVNLTAVLLSTTALTTLAGGSDAAAQSSERRENAVVEEVVVTATRQAEVLSKVPVSVAAYTQERMDAQGVRQISDVARMTPGVTFKQGGALAGGSTVAIRGISSAAGAATVGIYIDDTPYQIRSIGTVGFAYTSYPKVFDLQRVEILRGPQGTLFGSGSEGGTIRFINHDPSLTNYSAYARSEISDTKEGGVNFEAGAAVGGPIVQDKLGFRLSAYHRHDAGWIDRIDRGTQLLVNDDVNSGDATSVRGALTWAPTETLRLTPSVFYQDVKRGGNSNVWEYFSDRDKDVFRNADAVATPDHDKLFLGALKGELELPFATVTTNTSYIYRNDKGVRDDTFFLAALSGLVVSPATGIPAPAQDFLAPSSFVLKQNVFTQEIRAQSRNPDARLTWIAGVFYSRGLQKNIGPESSIGQTQWDLMLAAIPPANRNNYLKFPLAHGQFGYDAYNASVDKQLAAFGELSFKITEQLKATIGGRISKTSFDYDSVANGPYNNGLSIVGGKTKEKPITPKFSLSYQIDDANLVYATAAKGFRGGGANYQPPAACNAELASLGYSAAPIAYDFDSVWSYELGSKNRLFGGRLQLDSSIYQIDWDNIQQNASLSSCGFAFVRNAGKARSRGFDVAAQAQLGDDLSVGLSLGYNKAIYTTSIFGGLNAAGVRPPLVIEGQTLGTTPLTFAGFAEYQHDLFDDKRGYASLNFQYGEKSGLTAATDPRSPSFDAFNRRDPATFNLNLRAGVRFQGVDAALFANNVLDTHPLLSRGRAGGTRQRIYTYTTTPPRVVGLQLSYRY